LKLVSKIIICLFVWFLFIKIVHSQTTNLIPIKINGIYGYADDSMIIIIKPSFQDAYMFTGELARVKFKNKFGFINYSGKFQIPTIYDDATDFDGWGIATAKKKNDWIMIDKKGNLYNGVVPIDDGVHSSISEGNPGYYKNSNGKIGYIGTIYIDSANFKTDTIIKANYDEIKFQYTDRLFLVKQNNKYGFLSFKGDTLVPIIYDSIIQIGWDFNSNRNIGYKLYQNNLVGIFIHKENKIITPKYKNIISFNGQYARVLTKDNNEIYVSKNNTEFILKNINK